MKRKSPNPKQLPRLHSQPGRSGAAEPGLGWSSLPARPLGWPVGSSLWESMGVLPEELEGPLRPAHPGAECPLPRQSPEAPVLGSQARMAGAAVPGARPPPPACCKAHTQGGLAAPPGSASEAVTSPRLHRPALRSPTPRPPLSVSEPLLRPSAARQGPRESVGGGRVRGPRGGPRGRCPRGDLLGPSQVPALPHSPSTLV